MEVIGFLDGYKYAVLGPEQFDPKKHTRGLSIKDVSRLHLNGGSILGTAPDQPGQADDLSAWRPSAGSEVTMLVSIGGDDTAFSASQVYLKAGGHQSGPRAQDDRQRPAPAGVGAHVRFRNRPALRRVHRPLSRRGRKDDRAVVPDRQHGPRRGAPGIGHRQRRHVPDAHSRRVPRPGKRLTLDELCDIIVGSMLKRRTQERSYGMVVLAEGLLESIGEEGLLSVMTAGGASTATVDRDPHGHLRLGEIEFGRMVKDRLQSKVAEVGLRPIIDKDLGYELRAPTRSRSTSNTPATSATGRSSSSAQKMLRSTGR